jgi:hypothetical protein
MGQELAHGTTQGFFAEEDEAHQDFFLHRSPLSTLPMALNSPLSALDISVSGFAPERQ